MNPRDLVIVFAAAAILLSGSGCSTFRRLFADDRGRGEERREERGTPREGKRGGKRRDPVDDMFDLKRMRDHAPRHQGLQLTSEERAIFDAAEDSADRDRALIESEKRRMNSDRKDREDWVFSFKPEKRK